MLPLTTGPAGLASRGEELEVQHVETLALTLALIHQRPRSGILGSSLIQAGGTGPGLGQTPRQKYALATP